MYIISTVWPHNVYLQLLYFLLVSLRLSFCDIRDNYLTSLASIYTLGTAWVEQYTVFWDVPYAVQKVALYTKQQVWTRNTCLLYEKVAAVFVLIWLRFEPRSKPFFQIRLATTCTQSNELNTDKNFARIVLLCNDNEWHILQCLEFLALFLKAAFP